MPGSQMISIVTPSFNQGRFIEETIKSVLGQEGDFYLEYLIMDGGSTDGSVAIIKKYGALLKGGRWPVRCKGISYCWVSGKDEGQSDAINKGFKKATGGIVAWLNADDTYRPGALDKVARYFKEHGDTSMVYGEGYEIDESGKIIKRFAPTREFDIKRLIEGLNYILQPTVFMRSKALAELGYLDTDLHFVMDWDLWIRFGKNYRVGLIKDFLASARLYGDTKTSTGGMKRFRELKTMIRKYTDRRFPPSYFLYGYDCLLTDIGKKAPFIRRSVLKISSIIGGAVRALSNDRRHKEGAS